MPWRLEIRVAGASVHWVVGEVDGGSVIDHETVNITPQDTEDSLMERVLARELILYPRALAAAAKDVLARQL